MLRNAVGVEGVLNFPPKKHYEDVRFNVISVMRGWVGVRFAGKKHYLTLELPLIFQYFPGRLPKFQYIQRLEFRL